MKASTRKKLYIAAAAALLLIASGLLEHFGAWDRVLDAVSDSQAPVSSSQTQYIMTAEFIDVGQGDCSLFISDSHAMLVDSGEAEYAEAVIDVLEERGVEKLDYAVVTHAHSDHMGGMSEIIAACPPEKIILSEASDDSASTQGYTRLLDAIDSSGAQVIFASPGCTFTFGQASAEILAPYYVSESEENNNSVVMRVQAGDTSFLLTGDAEAKIERMLTEECPEKLSATVLKVGHHGSKTSSCEEFIEAVDPEIAVISVGRNNSYSHPAAQTLSVLSGARILRTDLSGSIRFFCSADSYEISEENSDG